MPSSLVYLRRLAKPWQCSSPLTTWDCNRRPALVDILLTRFYVVSTVTLLYAVWMLFQPVIFRSTASRAERQRAQGIVEQYGCSSLARFALLDDKSYFFSASGKSVIAYVPKGRGAVALGDPIGPGE